VNAEIEQKPATDQKAFLKERVWVRCTVNRTVVHTNGMLIFAGLKKPNMQVQAASEQQSNVINRIASVVCKDKALGPVTAYATTQVPGQSIVWLRSKNHAVKVAVDARLFDFVQTWWKSAVFFPVRTPEGGYLLRVESTRSKHKMLQRAVAILFGLIPGAVQAPEA